MSSVTSFSNVNRTYPLRVKDDKRGLFTKQDGFELECRLGHEQSGLFAAKDIDAGELIIRLARPLLAVLDSPHYNDTCSNCFVSTSENEDEEEQVKLSICGGCGVVRFCGKVCQTQSWSHSHKYECKIFKRLYPKVLPNTTRIVMQLLLQRKARTISTNDWKAIIRLLNHRDEFRSSPAHAETLQDIQLIARAAKEYAGSPEQLSFVEDLLSKVLVNTLTLTTSTYTPLGMAMDPLVSLINHSCAPNAAISFSGPTLSVYSLAPISKDMQITISYIDNSVPLPLRQTYLKFQYFFTCACTECRANRTLERPDIPPKLLPAADSGKLQKADAYGTERDAVARQYIDDDPSRGLNELGEAMRTIISLVPEMPYYRQPYAKLRADYVLACLATKDYLSAFKHSLVIYFHVDPVHFPQPFHPVRVVHKWTLFRLVLQVANMWQEGDAGLTRLVEEYGLNLGTILLGLSMEVEGNVAKGHGQESKFGVLVKRKMEQLRTDMRGVGAGQGPQAQDLEEQWNKLRKIASEVKV